MKVVHVDKSKAKRVLAEVTVHASVKEVSTGCCHHCPAIAQRDVWSFEPSARVSKPLSLTCQAVLLFPGLECANRLQQANRVRPKPRRLRAPEGRHQDPLQAQASRMQPEPLSAAGGQCSAGRSGGGRAHGPPRATLQHDRVRKLQGETCVFCLPACLRLSRESRLLGHGIKEHPQSCCEFIDASAVPKCSALSRRPV